MAASAHQNAIQCRRDRRRAIMSGWWRPQVGHGWRSVSAAIVFSALRRAAVRAASAEPPEPFTVRTSS
jgi:hypothetical protein